MELAVYDGDGQLLSGSFMDYAMPRPKSADVLCRRQPSGAGQDQSARRQGMRRGRLRRRPHGVRSAAWRTSGTQTS